MVGYSLTHRLGVSILHIPLSCVKPDDESCFAFVQQVLRVCAVRLPFPFFFIPLIGMITYEDCYCLQSMGIFLRAIKKATGVPHDARDHTTQVRCRNK
jgi:hypothetical protein